MDEEITVEWSKTLIRRATLRFWIRYVGWSRPLFAVVLIAVSAVLVYVGQRGWLTYFLGGAGVFLLVVLTAAYFVYCRRSLANFDLMEDPRSTFRFNEDGVSIRTDLGSSETKWKAFRKVWRFPEAWLLFCGGRIYITLPAGPLSPELKQFIARKVEESGGKVS